MRKVKSKTSFGEMILLGVGMYGLYKILGDNTPAIGQEIVPFYDPITGRESEEAKKKRIQKTMAVAKAYGINTYTWKEGKMGEDNLMDCLNFVYNVLRDAGYRDENGNEIPRSRTNNMHKQTAFLILLICSFLYTKTTVGLYFYFQENSSWGYCSICAVQSKRRHRYSIRTIS
ncbi:MAG: hypothetical protein IPL26_16175 [Leptospiraceae bacterium]|nr:hypothetical protein [Leptospiraceae bacterium]